MDAHQFLQLPLAEILAIQRAMGRPRAGAFVPDGSRRLVLAYTDFQPGSQEFYTAAARLPAQYVYQAIEIFFKYELSTLIVPILGRSMLKRGAEYLHFTALEGLRLLFNTPEWLELYQRLDIRVGVHGDIDCFRNTPCEPAIEWITRACETTAAHQSHQLHYAIGESSVVGEQMLANAVDFYQQHGHIPTREEQIQAYYGAPLPPLDFFIMTSKMSGMGALPNLLVDGDTEVYFLPTAAGITEFTYRSILFDMLFCRDALRRGIADFEVTQQNRQVLKNEYERSRDEVIGLGFAVGKVWVMDNKFNP